MSCTQDPNSLLDFLDGEMAPETARHLGECPDCQRLLASLKDCERTLVELGSDTPPADALLRVQRRVRLDLGIAKEREILTLEEAADFLRLEPDELAEVLDDLPWFELAGRIRFRRQALLDWVRARERECARERLSRNLQRELRTSA
jgi:hypothetical protein